MCHFSSESLYDKSQVRACRKFTTFQINGEYSLFHQIYPLLLRNDIKNYQNQFYSKFSKINMRCSKFLVR